MSHAEAVEQIFYYTVQQQDNSTGLYNIGQRWYAPFTGRLLSEDPSGLDPDTNPYRFTHNSFGNYVDPSGLYQAGNPLDGLFGGYRAGPVQASKPISQALSAGSVPVSTTALLNLPNFQSKNYTSSIPSLSTNVSFAQPSSFALPSFSNAAARTAALPASSLGVVSSSSLPSVSSAASYFTSRPGYYSELAAIAKTPSWQQAQQAYEAKVLRNASNLYAAADLGGYIQDPLIYNPRVNGVVQAATGFAQIGGGLFVAGVPFVGPLLGAGIGVRGADNLASGFTQLVTGRWQETKTGTALVNTLKYTGVSPNTAQQIGGYTETAFDFGTSLLGAAGPRGLRPAGVTTTIGDGTRTVAPSRNAFTNNPNSRQLKLWPDEPYNRGQHYGTTPTQADRAAMGAGSGQVVDHNPPLVKRYYQGDPATSELPGFNMTDAQRRASAADRSRMGLQSELDSQRQGGQMSGYSKNQKKIHGF